MNKQKPLALLMVTIAILMLAIACGSSDNTTTTPNQGVTTQPVTQTTAPPATEPSTPTEANPASPTTQAEATATQTLATPASTPWPTPLPTRTIAPTPRNPDQPAETATAVAPPPTEPAQETQTTDLQTPAVTVPLPVYDGSSPLIHAYVEEPFILFEGTPGATITLPIKGLTQDGQHVSIEDPTKWGITFKTREKTHPNDDLYTFDESGTFTVGTNPKSSATLEFNLRDHAFHVTVFHPTKEHLQTPVVIDRSNPATGTECWLANATSYITMDLNWFFITFDDPALEPALEQLALSTGSKPHGTHYFDKIKRQYTEGFKNGEQPLYLIQFSPGTCPEPQDTLNAVRQWAQTPGVTGIRHIRPDYQPFIFLRRDKR